MPEKMSQPKRSPVSPHLPGRILFLPDFCGCAMVKSHAHKRSAGANNLGMGAMFILRTGQPAAAQTALRAAHSLFSNIHRFRTPSFSPRR